LDNVEEESKSKFEPLIDSADGDDMRLIRQEAENPDLASLMMSESAR
jgi:hypothetical protein